MTRRLTLLISVLALVAVACSSSGEPTQLSQQRGEIAPEFQGALTADEDPQSVPLVQRNFIEGCVEGEQARLDGLSGPALLDACGCSYRAAESYAFGLASGETDEAIAEDAFTVFKDLNSSLEDPTGIIPAELLSAFEACRS